MSNYYVPPWARQGGSLHTPEGEEIGLGPYNSQQAPFFECASCATPITVGQAYCVTYRFLLGIAMQTGRLWPVSTPDWEHPVYYHEDCSAEFAHDHLTKEPCGNSEDECQFCGTDTNTGFKACGKCASNLGIPQ